MAENAQPPGRILVVDDEASIVDAVATALRYEGFDVAEARTGREALTAAARLDPDLVVLDWMLPDLEGIEVGRRLREQGFKTAILFLTAKDAVEHKVDALRAGGDDYVTKPFSLAEVVARVQAILRRTRAICRATSSASRISCSTRHGTKCSGGRRRST
jgi:two-component system OmpR family response regulator